MTLGSNTVIDESTATLHISRTYAAGVERAWWAWTDADAISRWWGPQGWVATVHEMDVRPGGRWRFRIEPVDGSSGPVRCVATYTAVDPLAELAYEDAFADETWQPDGAGTFPTTVTFTPAGSGCVVRVAAGFPDASALRRAVELGMAQGYTETLARLAGVLGDPPDTPPDTPLEGAPTMSASTVTSTDGTTIAYEKTGSGPALVVISTTAEDHTGVAGVADALSEHFTVINYDRRGRGASGDPQPYDPAREIEDIAALIDVVGGSAALAGCSGACALALDAATALGARATGLYLYEPSLIVDDSRPPAPSDYVEHVEALVAAGDRSGAVEYFMTEVIRVPDEYIPMMKQDPSWEEMARYAHTYAYDGRIHRGLVDGTPLPTDRWTVKAPIAVSVGSDGEPYMRAGAAALAALLPDVTVLTLDGHDHSAFYTAPGPVAEQARAFLLG